MCPLASNKIYIRSYIAYYIKFYIFVEIDAKSFKIGSFWHYLSVLSPKLKKDIT